MLIDRNDVLNKRAIILPEFRLSTKAQTWLACLLLSRISKTSHGEEKMQERQLGHQQSFTPSWLA